MGIAMEIADVQDAQLRLSKLVEQAMSGEEVGIVIAGRPMVRLVPLQIDNRHGGQWKGRVRIAKEFDDLPADIGATLTKEG